VFESPATHANVWQAPLPEEYVPFHPDASSQQGRPEIPEVLPSHCLSDDVLVRNGFYDWGSDHSLSERAVTGNLATVSSGCREFNAQSDALISPTSYTAVTWEGWNFGRALPCPAGAVKELHCRAAVLDFLRKASNASHAEALA